MPEMKSIADIVAAGADLQAHEAVAIAQQLMTPADVTTPADAAVDLTRIGRLSLSDVWLGSDGSVTCRACWGTPAVLEIGSVLAQMLPSGGKTRVPGALRYTVARALLEVDAPRFDSTAQFSAALKRYENGDRNVVLRELYARAVAVNPFVDIGQRRQQTPSAPQVWRQRREPDEELYLRLASEPSVGNGRMAVPHVEPAAIELISEPRPKRSAPSVRFHARRWVLGGVAAAAVTLSAGAGYIVVRMTARRADSPVTGTRSQGRVLQANAPAPRAVPREQAERVAPFRAETDSARRIGPAEGEPTAVEPNARMTSIYTPLSGQRCTTREEDQRDGSLVNACPGVAGFTLLIASRDERMSVTVVTPDAKEHPLDYWRVITTNSSRLGQVAEWRVIYRDGKPMPAALIARVYADDTDSRHHKNTSYLTVTKLTPGEICVTDRIPAGTDANERSRRAAAVAAGRACLQPV